MSRGMEEGNTDRVDRSYSYYKGAAEDSNDNDEPSNQYLDLPTSNWLATRCSLSQNHRCSATSNERLDWDSDLLLKAKSINDFENSERHYHTLGCNKLSSYEDIAQKLRHRKY